MLWWDMAAMWLAKIRYSHLVAHLIGGNLAGGVEEDVESSGHPSHGVEDLVRSVCVIGFVRRFESIQELCGDNYLSGCTSSPVWEHGHRHVSGSLLRWT
jgi:hypothetical protein